MPAAWVIVFTNPKSSYPTHMQAKEPQPPFPASIMDGYAVVASDGPGEEGSFFRHVPAYSTRTTNSTLAEHMPTPPTQRTSKQTTPTLAEHTPTHPPHHSGIYPVVGRVTAGVDPEDRGEKKEKQDPTRS